MPQLSNLRRHVKKSLNVAIDQIDTFGEAQVLPLKTGTTVVGWVAATGLTVYFGSSVAAWWAAGIEGDAAWFGLSLKDKVLYEIGQKTLSRGALTGLLTRIGMTETAFFELNAVERGTILVSQYGWWGALAPSGSGWALGAGVTFSTGPTPIFRWIVTPAAIYGGYKLYEYFNPKDPTKD